MSVNSGFRKNELDVVCIVKQLSKMTGTSFHLDLAQLWRCPVLRCTTWKSTPQDFVDHIRQKHSVPNSAKAANLGCWFPPWTVFGRSAVHASLRGKFMAKLRNFTVAEARWKSNRLPIRRNQLLASSDTLCSIRPRDPGDESALCGIPGRTGSVC